MEPFFISGMDWRRQKGEVLLTFDNGASRSGKSLSDKSMSSRDLQTISVFIFIFIFISFLEFFFSVGWRCDVASVLGGLLARRVKV